MVFLGIGRLPYEGISGPNKGVFEGCPDLAEGRWSVSGAIWRYVRMVGAPQCCVFGRPGHAVVSDGQPRPTKACWRVTGPCIGMWES